LNLAVFSLSRLRLEGAAKDGVADAVRVLALRRDANYTLATILWGNVAINVVLAQLADTLLSGVTAFIFSTVFITIVGEIAPQAYCARHALRVASFLAPVLRAYRLLLAPVAWPTGKLLDRWVGTEGIPWFREAELRTVLDQHAQAGTTDISPIEAVGAANFLALDDVPVGDEGEPLDPASVISLPSRDGRPVFPAIEKRADDPFLQQVMRSGKKWVVITDERDVPIAAFEAEALVRAVLFDARPVDALALCHRPLLVTDTKTPLGQVLGRFKVKAERPGDDVIDEDVLLVWAPGCRRIITGSDLLGRLLRRIVPTTPARV
jgi:CBS domain containing-hemolysin-like protein